MSQDRKPFEPREDKLELAKRIAEQSQKVFKTYNSIEFVFMRIVRFFSSWIDRLLFNPKNSKLVSFALAAILYVAINFNIGEIIFETPITSGVTIDNVPVSVLSNEEVYEISGLPSSVTAYVIGDLSDIALIRTQRAYSVVADLTGLLEGTHEVRLIPKDFSSRVEVALSQSTAVVTIRKRVSQNFNLEFDYINTDKMNPEFVLSPPILSDTQVIIRASQETLQSIGIVKALIDVSGASADFVQQAPIVAYDQFGNKMNVNIIPSTVQVQVGVSSPSRTVAIQVVPSGEVPNNLAIESIILDQDLVTIFGQESVINAIDAVVVPIDATSLVGNTTLVADIPLPSGIRKTSLSRVNMQITLAERQSTMVNDVFIQYINNVKGFRFTLINPDDTKTAIEVFGTATNLQNISPDDFYVYFDMEKIEEGEQDVVLILRTFKPLVRASLVKQTIRINVVR
jgi:YbbR domain-containing protein